MLDPGFPLERKAGPGQPKAGLKHAAPSEGGFFIITIRHIMSISSYYYWIILFVIFGLLPVIVTGLQILWCSITLFTIYFYILHQNWHFAHAQRSVYCFKHRMRN